MPTITKRKPRWSAATAGAAGRILRDPGEIALLDPRLSGRLAGCGGLPEEYPPAVTAYYLSLADPGDPDDPILAQCLPSAAEAAALGSGGDDPLDEAGQSPVPGLVHRYPDRVLMLVTNACFVRCRHCNRRRLWREPERAASPGELEAMLEYVRGHREVREVIISGGDPLTLGNRRLDELLAALRAIGHVDAIRIGTRAPVALPWRIDDGLCSVLERHAPVWINTHFNHPREVTPEAGAACLRLLKAGAPVGNQTVLLRGVNDSARIIAELNHALQRYGVRPYYLFLCDPVRGAEHFRTRIDEGIEIIARLRGFTSGLCVPALAVDTPGGGGKVTLQPECVVSRDGRKVTLRNFEGRLFVHEDPAR
jgi:lysine 2,3-aminomutase